MSGFSADWLALREPFDAAAREHALAAELRAHGVGGTEARPLEIVDLGAGAGSNLRYLAPRLAGAQRWRLVDHDSKLLEAALAATQSWARARGAGAELGSAGLSVRSAELACDVRCERADLAVLGALELPAGGLVTAAALLDLVSQPWLDTLAARCRAARAAVAFALTYDGRTELAPAEPEDGEVLELFNRHQLSDKGFGPALGPQAAAAAAATFTALGYTLRSAASDWLIGPESRAMQLALLDGWLGAAAEAAPHRRAALAAWHARRREHVAAGHATLRVGHVDVVGWL